jgi:hypothetical protein
MLDIECSLVCRLTKYAASTKPSINRHAISPPKVLQAAVAALITPHTTMQDGRYIAGLPIRFKNMLDGTCIIKYPTKRMETEVFAYVSIFIARKID